MMYDLTAAERETVILCLYSQLSALRASVQYGIPLEQTYYCETLIADLMSVITKLEEV